MSLSFKKLCAGVLSSALVLLSPGLSCYQALALTAQGPGGGAPVNGAAMFAPVLRPGFITALGGMSFQGVEVGPILSNLTKVNLTGPQGQAVAAAVSLRLSALGREPSRYDVLEALAAEAQESRAAAEKMIGGFEAGVKLQMIAQDPGRLGAVVGAMERAQAQAPLFPSQLLERVTATLSRAKALLSEFKLSQAKNTVDGGVASWEKREASPSEESETAPVSAENVVSGGTVLAPSTGETQAAEAAVPAPKKRADLDALPVTKSQVIGSLVGLLLPLAGFAAGMILALNHGLLDGKHLIVMGGMYAITVLGIGMGFHRLFTHRGFKTSKTMEIILGIMGSMSIEGPMSRWVAQHWIHHAHSDKQGDPHSPWLGKPGFWGTIKGAVHSHMGWMFTGDHPKTENYIKKIHENPTYKFISDYFPLWAALGVAIPAVIGMIMTGTWLGLLMGFLWGGAARVFLVHHVTFSINSICHLIGAKPFDSKDESRNNGLFGLLAFGEGWHNNHHAFQRSARHGLEWWQLDVSYLMLKGLSKLGLITELEKNIPTREEMDAKRSGAVGPDAKS